MKTATLRDGSTVVVGDLVDFWWEPGHVASGRVMKIYKARAESNVATKGWFGRSVLLVKGGDYLEEIMADEAWNADR